jgi:sec-independent protein translocase protein TatA
MDLFAPTHIILLLLVVLVIFGPSKLGDVGGAMGKGIRDFKRAINEPDSVPVPVITTAAAGTEVSVTEKTS